MRLTDSKGRHYDSIMSMLEARAKVAASCKHMKRFRKVESGVSGMDSRGTSRGWVRVRCTRCEEILESHMTPRLTVAVPITN